MPGVLTTFLLEEFDVFSQLRQLRKEMAEAEAVPVYALFTNEQLAQMVQRRCRTKSELLGIEGVGEAKVENKPPVLHRGKLTFNLATID